MQHEADEPFEVLQQALDDALADPMGNPQQKVELVAKLDNAFVNAGISSGETWIKARFVEALSNMLLNRLELSQQQLDKLKPNIDQQSFPVLWFRAHSLDASVLLMRAEREASVAAHEKLLSSPLEFIPQDLVERARSNYAESLRESGRIIEAADLYESIMLRAIERQADFISLQSGNNLITILLHQSDMRAARDTLDALKPVRERKPQNIGTFHLELKELQLRAMEGDYEGAISGLEDFLNAEPAPPNSLLSAGYQQLAETLCEKGDFERAFLCSTKAIELLGDLPNNIANARFTMARTLLKMQDYVGAIQQLDSIDDEHLQVPARRELANRLRLEAILKLNGQENELELFREMIAADDLSDKELTKSRSEYLNARLTAAQRNLELTRAGEITEALLEKNRIERRYKNLQLWLLSILAFVSCLSIFLVLKRRSAQILLKEQASANERLEALVNAKTEELRNNLKTHAELVEALEKKKRIEAIGLLAGNIAHDLNNLFQVISSTNECLSNPTSTPEQRAQFLAVSNESLRHGAGIVKQLLASTRNQELVSTPMRFTDYLRATEDLLRSAIGESTQFTILDKSLGASICLDTSQMTAALLNIFSNALDAMPSGGSIELEATRCNSEDEQCEWTDLNQEEFLYLKIRDSGVGMSAEQVARAFEPFYSTKPAESGSGLGLSSVQVFVRKSGGDIRVLSEINQGTEVQIILPLAEIEPPVMQQHSNELSFDGAYRRVLMVEDDEAVAQSLVALLESLEFHVKWASCSRDALKLLKEDREFDFVLSDVRMPGDMDGLALAQWIKKEKKGLPVFLMSGFNDLPISDLNFPLLAKPFNLAQLRQFLRRYLDSKPINPPSSQMS